jgi:hypothetical protein
LILDADLQQKVGDRRGESDEAAGPLLTLLVVRRALQRLLPPACHLDCPFRRALAHRQS